MLNCNVQKLHAEGVLTFQGGCAVLTRHRLGTGVGRKLPGAVDRHLHLCESHRGYTLAVVVHLLDGDVPNQNKGATF